MVTILACKEWLAVTVAILDLFLCVIRVCLVVLPHLDVSGPSEPIDGDQGLDDGPLGIGQVGGVGLSHRGMLHRRCVLPAS